MSVPDRDVVDGHRTVLAIQPVTGLDHATGQTRRTELTQYVTRERAPFKHLENQEPKPMNTLDGGWRRARGQRLKR